MIMKLYCFFFLVLCFNGSFIFAALNAALVEAFEATFVGEKEVFKRPFQTTHRAIQTAVNDSSNVEEASGKIDILVELAERTFQAPPALTAEYKARLKIKMLQSLRPENKAEFDWLEDVTYSFSQRLVDPVYAETFFQMHQRISKIIYLNAKNMQKSIVVGLYQLGSSEVRPAHKAAFREIYLAFLRMLGVSKAKAMEWVSILQEVMSNVRGKEESKSRNPNPREGPLEESPRKRPRVEACESMTSEEILQEPGKYLNALVDCTEGKDQKVENFKTIYEDFIEAHFQDCSGSTLEDIRECHWDSISKVIG